MYFLLAYKILENKKEISLYVFKKIFFIENIFLPTKHTSGRNITR